jgi:hypothetical protein
MVLKPLDLRRVAPPALSGASGLFIMVRVWRLSRAPAQVMPFARFLLAHKDLVGVLCGYPLMMLLLAKPENLHQALQSLTATTTSATEHLSRELHELRQVFTTLLLGLGLIERRARTAHTAEVILLTHRLKRIVDDGIDNLKSLEAVREQLRNIPAVGERHVREEREHT